MKVNLPVTNTEHQLDVADSIISTTDIKGSITSVNKTFIEISGFSEEELLGKNHNLVRHPDVPPAAFTDLWDTLKVGDNWMGIVKNRCKNGDYYWVDAYVAPIYDGTKVIGYQSVRTKPDQDKVDRAESLYSKLSAGKIPFLLRYKWNYMHQMFTTLTLVLMSVLGGLVLAGALDLAAGMSALLAGLGGSYIASLVVTRSIRTLAARARGIVDNPVMQMVYEGRRDEVGQVRTALDMLEAKLRTMETRILDCSGHLIAAAENSSTTATKTRADLKQQENEIQQVATAMTEMSSTVREVSNNASEAANSAHQAAEEVDKGKTVVEQTINSINQLSQEVENSTEVIHQLEQDSQNIGSVLEVINAVAEQTNLLALNAAIEAARAGEQGRGFAVVADEVRTLAGKTQQSTEEIRKMIDDLQSGVTRAVDAMSISRKKAHVGVEQVSEAGKSLDSIAQAVHVINDMNAHIAVAANQQSTVTEEINQSICNITQLVEQSAHGADKVMKASEKVGEVTEELHVVVKQCGTGRCVL